MKNKRYFDTCGTILSNSEKLFYGLLNYWRFGYFFTEADYKWFSFKWLPYNIIENSKQSSIHEGVFTKGNIHILLAIISESTSNLYNRDTRLSLNKQWIIELQKIYIYIINILTCFTVHSTKMWWAKEKFSEWFLAPSTNVWSMITPNLNSLCKSKNNLVLMLLLLPIHKSIPLENHHLLN